MRRRAKPAKAKVQGKRPPTRTSPRSADARVRDLEKRLAEALKGKAETLEQQTATSEILRTIAQTQKDVQPVFDTIVQNAARLCHASNAAVFLTDGRMVHHPANYGSTPEALADARAVPPAIGHGQHARRGDLDAVRRSSAGYRGPVGECAGRGGWPSAGLPEHGGGPIAA